MYSNRGRLDLEGVHRVIFDGHDLTKTFEVLDVIPDGFPEVTDYSAELQEGEHFFGRRIGARNVTVSLSLHTFTRDPLAVLREWRRVSPVLTKPDPRKLYLDEPMYLNAVLTGETTLGFLGDRALIEVAFKCHDPYFHGDWHEIPIEGETRFRVVSQCATWPVFEIDATGDVIVSEEASGLRVVVPGAGGKHVRIVTSEMKAYANGAYAPVDMEQTDYFPFEPGIDHTLTLEGGTGAVSYEERAL